LIVDDRADIRAFLNELLQVSGFTPLEATDADEAVLLARKERPALILMDVMMPGRDGLSAIHEIRQDGSQAGIIVMTAFGTEQRAVQAMRVGADDYLHKPFDVAELQIKINAALEKNRLRVENQRLQERLQAILSHYMPPTVAESLIKAPELPSLGGERQEVTLLFADLRGFTVFAAQTSSEELLRRLNRYLTIATNAILAEKGTLDKFMGDGVMAIFNAPLRESEHVFRAVRAAINIQRGVDIFNQTEADAQPLRFGIGIHTGEAVVGNIGTTQLMTYTAIGDPVNVAKQLEEMAEPGQIIVSEAIVKTLDNRLVVKALEPVRLKGHAELMPVFEVVSLAI